jgi:hypothetical protein
MPDGAVARRSDPKTSWDAARSVRGLTETQYRVLFLLRLQGPLTDEEIWHQHLYTLPGIFVSQSGLRTRRAELVDKGIIVDTGRTRPTDAGRDSIVWDVAGGYALLGTPSVWEITPDPENEEPEPEWKELPEYEGRV